MKEVAEAELRNAQRLGRWAILHGADHLHVRPLGDGRAVYLAPILGGNVRLCVGVLGSLCYEDGWCYQAAQHDAAWRAALGWDGEGEGEPEGWHRHPDTGRRRPDGDPARETVYW